MALTLAVASGAAAAGDGAATDEAFSLLLAMPGAQPTEGGWIIPGDAAADEKDLIAQWQRLKKAGADFNAFRHQGTLLAHAIRAGKEQAALWLLRQGADSRKVLLDDRADAYALAKTYRRAVVLKALEAQPGFKTAPPAVAAQPAAPASAAKTPAQGDRNLTRVEQAAAELRRLVGPHRQPDDAAQQAWLRYARGLSTNEFQALFQNGDHLAELVIVTRHLDGALDDALGRLPLALVRAHAQQIASQLGDWSYITYSTGANRITYTGASRAWPALWKRLDQPLRYEGYPTNLPERIPPALWPGLFASGYPASQAEATGCLLASVDLPALQALWPAFQRYFTDARDEAPGLVLAAWRLHRERSPCYYASGDAETAAKLEWLQAQGMRQTVPGLVKTLAGNPPEPALARLLAAVRPKAPATPRLVPVPRRCEPVLGEPWLNALVRAGTVGWGTPADTVRLIDVPGRSTCGLIVSGDTFPEWSRLNDSFTSGPSQDPPTPRCADMPDDAEVWTLEGSTVQRVAVSQDTRGIGFAALMAVRDVKTGKRYWLDGGQTGAACAVSYQLPGTYEWRTEAAGHQLVPSPDGALVTRLLREQCVRTDEDGDVNCFGRASTEAADDERKPVMARLRAGASVPMQALIDDVGAPRRAAFQQALAAHDHARLKSLRAEGLPARWTAQEIAALAGADLPLAEKRRRVALLFADAGQLEGALRSSAGLPLGWLPREDWGPILRIIRKSPEQWLERAQALRESASEAVACEVDWALGFVCGGGLQPN